MYAISSSFTQDYPSPFISSLTTSLAVISFLEKRILHRFIVNGLQAPVLCFILLLV